MVYHHGISGKKFSIHSLCITKSISIAKLIYLTLAFILLGVALSPEISRAAEFVFLDVSTSSGIGAYTMSAGMGGGISAADFDSDGDIDIFVPNGNGIPDQLYRNMGNGQFEEIASLVGLGSTLANRCALWFDYDGDHDLDIIVANDVEGNPSTFTLYRQIAGPQFEDVTASAGLMIPMTDRIATGFPFHRGGIAAGDFNNDGFLDLFCARWNGESHMFFNNGNGTFTNVSASSGAATSNWIHQPIIADLNNDGWLDMYFLIDFNPNQLWINQHDGTFVEIAASAGADNNMNDMGVALSDYDNDGDWDIYATNVFDQGKHSILLRNDTIGSAVAFTEVSQSLGVDNTWWGWGATFLDIDNNGWMDLAVTNGWGAGVEFVSDPSKLFYNLVDTGSVFSDMSTEVNFNDTDWGSSLISLDYDRDGDNDIMQTCMGGPLRLLENSRTGVAATNSYLTVKPRMLGTNHFAIGAIVEVKVGANTYRRLITAGTSYLGQEPAEALFGLGTASIVDVLTVFWPGGSQIQLNNVSVNQVITVMQALPIPTVDTWGLVAMMLVITSVGTVLLRVRRIAA